MTISCLSHNNGADMWSCKINLLVSLKVFLFLFIYFLYKIYWGIIVENVTYCC